MLKKILLSTLKLSGFLVLLVVAAGLAFWYTLVRVTDEKAEVVVPSLVRLDQRQALAALDAVDLRLVIEDETKSQYDPSIPRDHVARQEPAPGTRLKAGRRVRVVLSLGPHDRNVPRVMETTVSEAQVRLHESGLTVGDVVYVRSGAIRENTVIAQEPGPEDGAKDGVVNLLVSSGEPRPVYVAPDLIGRKLYRVLPFLKDNEFKVKLEYEDYPSLPEGTVIRQRPRAGHPLRSRDIIWLWTVRAREEAPL